MLINSYCKTLELCISPRRMSEVACNSVSEFSSGSPWLKTPEVESEMHVMNVVWVKKHDCSKLLKGSTFKNDMDTCASLRVYISEN